MATPALVISQLLQDHRPDIYAQWMVEVERIWGSPAGGLIRKSEVQHQADTMLSQLQEAMSSHTGQAALDAEGTAALVCVARAFGADLARTGLKAQDIAYYVIALKNVLTQRLVLGAICSPAQLADCLRVLADVLDQVSLLTFDAFVAARERVIAQQSMSLLELSTPVILLWTNILLLPLVGVIDTVRARHFTERLLEFIARHEAAVTIIDVTGVPVFDTSVARHMMKAVDAAELLGSRIIMTGISPEGAQTMTTLGVSFSNVLTRANLRSGVAEALQLVGRRIEIVGRGRP